MPLVKFAIVPDSSSYSVQDGSEVVSTQLDGGASRYRKDIANATSRVDVTWVVSDAGYQYIRAFFIAITEKGATPFLIDLLLDEPILTEHTAYFVANSLRLNETRGGIHKFSAQLEVKPNTLANAEDIVYMYNALGDNWMQWEDQLNTIVNTDWPDAL